ncbi:MAG: hypothetical protein ACI8VT_001400 [Saprospiraceae bacterium]|jgi:hypothetical protein
MANNIFPKIYHYIKEDKVKESLEFLMTEVPEKSKEWLLFLNRLASLEKKNNLGTLSLDDYNPEKAKIIYGLTHELDSVTSEKELETEKEASGSAELVTSMVADQIRFLRYKIRELNLFQIGLGVFTAIVFFVSAFYLVRKMDILEEINVFWFSLFLSVLYFLIILFSLFLIHLTKGSLSDNKTKFSVYRQVFGKIKI